MTGIWSLPVHLTGDSFKGSALLARVVINTIFLPGIVWAIYQQPPRTNTAFDGIRHGTFVLLGWYIITIVDLFLHETQIKAAYGYILLGFFQEAFKIASGVLIIAATHRILAAEVYACDQIQRWKAKTWLLVGEFLILVVSIMGLYYLGSLLSNEVLWLGISNPRTVDSVASRKESLQTAFFVIQWMLALMILCGSAIIAWIRRHDYSEGGQGIMIAATLLLWIRALTELIVSIHYRPVPDGNAAARDAMYGICTILFLWLIHRAAYDMLSESVGGDSLQARMLEDTRRKVLQFVDDIVSDGQRPPPLRTILERYRLYPASALSTATVQELAGKTEAELQSLNDQHERYIARLIASYGSLGEVQQVNGTK